MTVLVAIDGSEASMLGVPIVNGLALPSTSSIELLTMIPEDLGAFMPWPAGAMFQFPAALDESLAAAQARLESLAGDLAADFVGTSGIFRHAAVKVLSVVDPGMP